MILWDKLTKKETKRLDEHCKKLGTVKHKGKDIPYKEWLRTLPPQWFKDLDDVIDSSDVFEKRGKK